MGRICLAGRKGALLPDGTIRVAEMFAGVGGFRLGLEGYSNAEHPELAMPPAGRFKTVWANQWEPDGRASKQFAWRCYESRFGVGTCLNQDINKVLDDVEAGKTRLPDFDMLVGGFPCQDYSVAKPLSLARGIEGKKGVLWWDIYRMLRLKRPRLLLLENVDRLLKSPSAQRGRDFAIILSCLAAEGYSVEWRVINAADYGMPQRRRRVYIFGMRDASPWDLRDVVRSSGVLARAFPVSPALVKERELQVGEDPYATSKGFGVGLKVSPFQSAGAMQNGAVFTAKAEPDYDGPRMTLGDVLVDDADVPEGFFIGDDPDRLGRWEYLKGPKREKRTARSGFVYEYTEGGMAFPDRLDMPSRTILTGEGGSGPSRTKHVVRGSSGKLRRLVPDELDQLQGFPKGWTKEEGGRLMSDGHRAFCMGNALVVGIPHRIGKVLAADFASGSLGL